MSPKIRILIPLLIMAGCQLYTWLLVCLRFYYPTMQKGISLVLLISLFHFYFTRVRWCIVFTGLYLFLVTINCLTLTPATTALFLGFGRGENAIYTPGVQLIGLGLLVLYGVLNFDQLVEMYLDYKESRTKKD